MSPGDKIEPDECVETMTNNNGAVTKGGVITRAVTSNGDTPDTTGGGAAAAGGLIEEVVEEGHIVLEQGQQVVMVTEGEMGQQQIVITDGGAGLIQLDNGQQLLMKSEPEDLTTVRDIDMEAGAQAIQASAAAAVQNVIRSLKSNDSKVVSAPSGGVGGGMLQSILPNHMAAAVASDKLGNIVYVEEGDHAVSTNGVSPNKRARTSTGQADNSSRLQIAKQYTPFGFHCILEAATAQWVRKEEDRCTYMNKGQFYGLTLEYRHNASEPFPGDLKQVKSVIMLVFRDAKNPEDEINAWDFWHQRQPTSKQRIIDAETNNINEQCGVIQVEDVAYNAIAVYWNPLDKPAFISLAVQCLSTDFSLQKGVKGLPMHLQVDTYCRQTSDSDYDLVHRAYCQVKVFCDKGAERKFRQEERRAARKVAVGGQRVLDMYHQCQERSEFYSMVDLSKTPVLYTPQPGQQSQNTILGLQQPAIAGGSAPSSGAVSILKSNNPGVGVAAPDTRRKTIPPPESRMVVYVRQENEEIYTPLHLVPPTVPGLARAIESKYNVSASSIRYLYRRNKKGITAKLDDDLLKFYCNEDTFLMQVTAIELEGCEGQDSIMYDITLQEVN